MLFRSLTCFSVQLASNGPLSVDTRPCPVCRVGGKRGVVFQLLFSPPLSEPCLQLLLHTALQYRGLGLSSAFDLFDESEDSVGCTHLTHLSIFGYSTIPVPLCHVPGVTLSIWLLWELRRHEVSHLLGDPAFAPVERVVCCRSPVRFLPPFH